jgi:D-alanyl-D-alanine carboxypeptidase/D-alanyl-D-alanine-endopeptidase (penicillin-binding protein 4)
MQRLVSLSIISLFFIHQALAEDTLNLPALVKNGSVRVDLTDGSPLLRYRDNEPFVPASVLKVATAFCALEQLKDDFRFETLFLTDSSYTLFIKGSGDPALVSETLEAVAEQLANKLQRVDRIVIDTSFFADDLRIDGSERSLNPYDAKNSAFVGNYASATITHSKQGTIASAEARVNLSTDWRVGTRYGGELLAAFLLKKGLRGSMNIELGAVKPDARVILRHRSPLTLGQVVQGMLDYSTNFTANQLFLVLGASVHGAPATVTKGQEVMRECLEQKVGWKDFHVEEGSGLSRKNRITSAQMTALLASFERYRFLMPEKNGFIAKTGTLRGVSSLAGYLDLGGSLGQARFSILINSDVPYNYKFHVARELQKSLQQN